jgi:hypothetical protein
MRECKVSGKRPQFAGTKGVRRRAGASIMNKMGAGSLPTFARLALAAASDADDKTLVRT